MNLPASATHEVDGPDIDDLFVGQQFDTAPKLQLTDGLAAVHHSIIGGRFNIVSDPLLSSNILGEDASLVSPALAWDVAIGQSTQVTQKAIANLQYTGLVFRRYPRLGDTLSTCTTVVGLRAVSAKPDRPARGIVEVRVQTTDQNNCTILDFHRRAMLPARGASAIEQQGIFGETPAEMTTEQLAKSVMHWDLTTFRNHLSGPHFSDIKVNSRFHVPGGDVVSSAPELARLTMNLASVHHDATNSPSGKRLVYGGHTIGLAAAQITRALPGLVTILGWHDCIHIGPVYEGDTLHSQIEIEKCDVLPTGGGLVHLSTRLTATEPGGSARDVLHWRLVGLFA